MAALACNPGDRLVDLRDKISRGLNSIDLMVTVEPFYARFYIYQPGFPDSRLLSPRQQAFFDYQGARWSTAVSASDKVARGMKWTVRALFRPDIEM